MIQIVITKCNTTWTPTLFLLQKFKKEISVMLHALMHALIHEIKYFDDGMEI